MSDHGDRIAGCLLGLAVGDALGLPYEGLGPRRATRLFGTGPLRHRFLLGRGLLSDDTEHAAMTAQALLVSSDDPSRFARSLAWRLRLWLLGLPAGVGFATLRSIVKLWLGVPPSRSGVRSAGNGPAMRAPILGALFAADPSRRAAFVRVATRLTHTDPRAEAGARLLADAVADASRRPKGDLDPKALLGGLRARAEGEELRRLLTTAAGHLERGSEAIEYARAIGQGDGISGYINYSLPAALYCFLRHPADFRETVEAAVRLGGDTDSVAGVAGALSGATLGVEAIPGPWLDGLADYPRSVAWLRRLARRLAESSVGGRPPPEPLFWPALVVRNAVFLTVVLAHGFRRLLPPY